MDKQVVQHLPALVLSISVSAQVALSISMQSILHDEAESMPCVLFFSSGLMCKITRGTCKQAHFPAGCRPLLESWPGCLPHLPS
jgi:hypothetical protein